MNRISRSLILAVTAIALVLVPAASAQSAAPQPAPQKETRLKLAEGEYLLEGKFDGQTAAFRDTWTLWATAQGSYEVEEFLNMKAEGESISMTNLLSLTRSFRPVSAQVALSTILDGQPVRVGFTMQFDTTEFRVEGLDKPVRVKTKGPYEFFLPTPWFLSSIALRARENGNRDTDLSLLMFTDDCTDPPPGYEDELEMTGRVRFLGRGFVHIRGTTWQADRYEIQASDMPAILVWLSDEGIVLGIEGMKEPELRIELIRYKQFRDFAPATLAPES